MIYNDILKLQEVTGLFNREPITSEKLIGLAAQKGIRAFTDLSTLTAEAFIYKNKSYIAYNPHLPESHIVLNVGHELGHFGLGHIAPHKSPLTASIFSKRRNERDAGIIGFLCWIPTNELCRMERNGKLNIDELYKLIRCLDGDLIEDEVLRLCHSRISIYNGFRRVIRQFMIPKQQKFYFPPVQLPLF